MSFDHPHAYQVGALYAGTVRDYHRYYDVPIRETKHFLLSTFYISPNSLPERSLIRKIEALAAHVEELDEEKRREERAVIRAKQARKLVRRNLWRRATLRKPLAS